MAKTGKLVAKTFQSKRILFKTMWKKNIELDGEALDNERQF